MALEPLAAVVDLEDRLGRVLTDDEVGRAEALLRDASATVRDYTHQDISFVQDDVVEVVPQGVWVTLPQRPVSTANPITVTVDGAAVTGFKVIRDRLWMETGWPPFGPTDTRFFDPRLPEPVVVKVTYSHGYAEIPDGVVAVVCGLVLRALSSDRPEAGVQQETIDDYSYRLADGAQAGVLGLLLPERRMLNRYRRTARTTPL